jgi:predicted amidohydrolase YtcJ
MCRTSGTTGSRTDTVQTGTRRESGGCFLKEAAGLTADCHIHMVLDGVYWRAAIDRYRAGVRDDAVRATLVEYQKRGVTYLRDGGDRWGAALRAAQLAPEYGIRYRAPAWPICRKGRYGAFIGRTCETFEEYKTLVRGTKAAGGSFVKLMISGLIDFDHLGVVTSEPLSPQEIRSWIAFAHDEGFAVMAHANGDETVAAALAAGVDSVEHGAYLRGETLCRLAESGAVWVPTLVTIGNLIGDGRYPDAVLKPLLEQQLENVRFAAARGARIAAGSDAGAYRVLHGQGTLDEYALLRRALGADTEKILDAGLAEIQKRF